MYVYSVKKLLLYLGDFYFNVFSQTTDFGWMLLVFDNIRIISRFHFLLPLDSNKLMKVTDSFLYFGPWSLHLCIIHSIASRSSFTLLRIDKLIVLTLTQWTPTPSDMIIFSFVNSSLRMFIFV